jgi:hypothetical protein
MGYQYKFFAKLDMEVVRLIIALFPNISEFY